MAAWIAATALRVLDLLPAALRARLGLTNAERDTWRRISSRMFVPIHDTDAGPVFSQFEGYLQLDELDWTSYRAEHTNIQRLDRILKADGDDPDRYQMAKQADTVMLVMLFSPDELRGCLNSSATPTTRTWHNGPPTTTATGAPRTAPH